MNNPFLNSILIRLGTKRWYLLTFAGGSVVGYFLCAWLAGFFSGTME